MHDALASSIAGRAGRIQDHVAGSDGHVMSWGCDRVHRFRTFSTRIRALPFHIRGGEPIMRYAFRQAAESDGDGARPPETRRPARS